MQNSHSLLRSSLDKIVKSGQLFFIFLKFFKFWSLSLFSSFSLSLSMSWVTLECLGELSGSDFNNGHLFTHLGKTP